jgi:hypothetical protein
MRAALMPASARSASRETYQSWENGDISGRIFAGC